MKLQSSFSWCVLIISIFLQVKVFFLLFVIVKVYSLTQRMEELEKDRDRVRSALERTEAAMIGYRERAHQQEQGPGAGPNPDEVSVSLIGRLVCQSASFRVMTVCFSHLDVLST